MRYVLAAILIGAIGAPAASALPAVSPDAVSLSKASPIEQVGAKRGKTSASSSASKQGKKSGAASGGGAGGIHPLVGSGDY